MSVTPSFTENYCSRGPMVLPHVRARQHRLMLAIMDRPKARAALAKASAVTGVSEEDIVSSRRRCHVPARDYFCWLLHEPNGVYSLPFIGRLVDRHHTSVMAAIRRHQARECANG